MLILRIIVKACVFLSKYSVQQINDSLATGLNFHSELQGTTLWDLKYLAKWARLEIAV
jgi:hypothetical protein